MKPGSSRLGIVLILQLVLVLASLCSGVPPPAPDEGTYNQPDETIPSPEGEIAIDKQTGEALPEKMNDGELEGGADHHISWNYNEQSLWALEYPECTGKKLRQSPIDIRTNDVIFKPQMQLQFVDWDQDVEFEYKNTHHSVSLTPIPSFAPPSIRVNWVDWGQPDEYDLVEVHFHWGHAHQKGSEHEINNEKAAAEMHMVHYRKGLNKSQIGSVDNSVVVIGVFIESDHVEHNKLESLVEKAEYVNGTDAEYTDRSPEHLISLLPDNHHSFYTYNGSLTTPPCYEVVTWIIMSEPVYMYQERLEELSNFEVYKAGLGRQKLPSNNRAIQPLLLRPVYASFNTTESVTHSQERIGHRIGVEGQRLHQALARLWDRFNEEFKVTVKRAYANVHRARRGLMETVMRENGGSLFGGGSP